ncbi:TerB family tellurite resistance protein [Mucilaginibacter sp. L3T2-6]|uniref:TerB family tellurite resistance protein n=1 Tax=Mucilaginibacter sp. L3T2-6 TaxID=3062491 RepID=UPI002674E3A6|nr:TerB family tellurite resistance protein [Mucilaginibacter sp. L3T2-6]MDO3641236.1 TerB family tellurite resistance protein [Mucilaginibacter sp. L3T2-6]MDV6214005.1 TerB family tellurite resistance protein [Mucilaginibacter sp. L3T2-6]
MKKTISILLIALALGLAVPKAGKAQSIADCIEQLTLDYRKLSGLKRILSQMYQGYEIVSKGYRAVQDVSKGNFSLHEAFLDGLMIVSPAVRQYPRVADIINDQATILSEYRSAWAMFRVNGRFSPDEIVYIMDVYNNLISASLKNINDLTIILTDGRLRMSDAERLAAIDRIYTGGHGQLSFLRGFNDHTYRLAVQRAREAGDQQTLKSLYGIN